MDERFSPEKHLLKLTQDWIGTVLIMGAILFPVLEFMDYFISIDNFQRFMTYRLAVSALLIILYYLNRLRQNKAYQYAIAIIGTALCAITVELAILQSGGQNSPYYAAMLILAVCCLSFVPFSVPLSFVLVAIIYGIYLAPIMLTEKITSGVFVSNNAFLISTFVIGLLLRYYNQKLIGTELQLRAELSDDKRTLELYSRGLKDQVAEKTGALEISEQKYRAFFDNANDGIAVLDQSGNITDVNLRFCELHGFQQDAVLGTSIRLIELEKARGEFDERFRKMLNNESLVYEAEHYRKDGSKVLLEVSSRAISIGGAPHIQCFYRDITEKIKLQEQVLQSQKMDSLGVLAGGIAHDFNNVLTAILGHTEVLRRHVVTDEFGKRRIKTIEEAALRAGQMVSKLLSFARKKSLTLAPTDLNAVVMDTAELLGPALLDRNCSVQALLDEDLPPIKGDSIHLEQVIANLVMNAVDAMPEGGVITIATALKAKAAEAPAVYPCQPPDAQVLLTVKDTGTGIPRETLDKIFVPFFTTKAEGKGTGLGLAMVYGIVKSHNGEILVRSREGEGTTFELYFPTAEHSVELRAVSSTQAP